MEKASLQKRLYSESNLYLAAYLAPSYVFNEELLCSEDRQTLHALKDAYNEDVYQETMESVKMRLQKIMNDPNDYFHTEVYFKPKSFMETKDGNGEGSMVFRPLHTANLVDQIAMVAMLQLLVYDVQDDNTLVPSETTASEYCAYSALIQRLSATYHTQLMSGCRLNSPNSQGINPFPFDVYQVSLIPPM